MKDSNKLLLISIIAFLSSVVLYLYVKNKEKDNIKEYINKSLVEENENMKKELEYLRNYKTDISKTFRILDNELHLIKSELQKNAFVNNDNEKDVIIDNIFNRIFGDRNERLENEDVTEEVKLEELKILETPNVELKKNVDILPTIYEESEEIECENKIENNNVPMHVPTKYDLQLI